MCEITQSLLANVYYVMIIKNESRYEIIANAGLEEHNIFLLSF